MVCLSSISIQNLNYCVNVVIPTLTNPSNFHLISFFKFSCRSNNIMKRNKQGIIQKASNLSFMLAVGKKNTTRIKKHGGFPS